MPKNAPHADSLRRVLADGVQRGLLTATGHQGTKADPQRYGLPFHGSIP
jgi:hypothetical protein